MKLAFVDTQYLIAIFQESDQWHEKAIEVELHISDYAFVTTDSILAEILNYFCGFGDDVRAEVAGLVRDVISDPKFQVIEQTRTLFLNGVDLYESRLDKGYSLTDCITMNVCRELGINEILSNDKHFTQEGLTILL